MTPAAGDATANFNFATGYYTYDDQNTLTVVLFDGTPESPRAALTVRMFWQPRAANTPIDPAATNSTVHLIVFQPNDAGREVAVYAGAGFMYPYDRPGAGRLQGGVWEANLRLADASAGYRDSFGQAMIRGKFTAHLSAALTEEHLHHLRVLVQEGLGYPRLVLRD